MKNRTKILAALLALSMLATSSFCVFADETDAVDDSVVVTAADAADETAADTAEDAADAEEADEEVTDAEDAETAEKADAETTEAEEAEDGTEAEAAPIVLSVDGEAVSISGAGEAIDGVVAGAKAEYVDGVLMLPLRAVCEKLGCAVEWYAEERQVVIVKDDTLRTVTLDNAQMTILRVLPLSTEDNAMAVNKTVADLAPVPTLIGDLTYVPVAFFEAFGLTVQGL